MRASESKSLSVKLKCFLRPIHHKSKKAEKLELCGISVSYLKRPFDWFHLVLISKNIDVDLESEQKLERDNGNNLIASFLIEDTSGTTLIQTPLLYPTRQTMP